MEISGLKKFGKELKSIREQKDIPLQQIFIKTRIDIKFLQAIEEGNFSIMPDVYIRAFIKEYVSALDLDPSTYLKKYEMAKTGKDITNVVEEPKADESSQAKPVSAKEYVSNVEDTFENEEKTNNSNINQKYFFIAFGVLSVLLLAYLFFIKSSDPEIITEKPFEEVIESNNQRYEETETIVDSTMHSFVDVTSDSLQLLLKSKDNCWIGATIDNNKELDFILYSIIFFYYLEYYE